MLTLVFASQRSTRSAGKRIQRACTACNTQNCARELPGKILAGVDPLAPPPWFHGHLGTVVARATSHSTSAHRIELPVPRMLPATSRPSIPGASSATMPPSRGRSPDRSQLSHLSPLARPLLRRRLLTADPQVPRLARPRPTPIPRPFRRSAANPPAGTQHPCHRSLRDRSLPESSRVVTMHRFAFTPSTVLGSCASSSRSWRRRGERRGPPTGQQSFDFDAVYSASVVDAPGRAEDGHLGRQGQLGVVDDEELDREGEEGVEEQRGLFPVPRERGRTCWERGRTPCNRPPAPWDRGRTCWNRGRTPCDRPPVPGNRGRT